VDQAVVYKMLDADPAQYPGQIIDTHLKNRQIDVAVVWGPIAGYFAKQSPGSLRVLPLQSEAGVRFDYPIAMGVRYGEREWKQQVETLIEQSQAEILSILQEFGVPLVEDPDARAR
jgi:ABC-type amino acid transport substrate-binding protein